MSPLPHCCLHTSKLCATVNNFRVKLKRVKSAVLTSSELSPQSLSVSHCHGLGIQRLLLHLKWVAAQVLSTGSHVPLTWTRFPSGQLQSLLFPASWIPRENTQIKWNVFSVSTIIPSLNYFLQTTFHISNKTCLSYPELNNVGLRMRSLQTTHYLLPNSLTSENAAHSGHTVLKAEFHWRISRTVGTFIQLVKC